MVSQWLAMSRLLPIDSLLPIFPIFLIKLKYQIIMKKFLISVTLLLLSIFINTSLSAHSIDKDSLVVQFGNKKVVIYVSDSRHKERLQQMYDNGSLRNTLRYLDSNQIADTAFVRDNSGEYRIIKQNGETVIYYDKVEDVKNQRNNRIEINSNNRDGYYRNWNNDNDNNNNNDNNRRNRYRSYTGTDFGFDIGTNIMIPKTGSFSGTLYELNPLRSTYIALSFMNRINFGRYARARVGLEVSWYNFSFEKDVLLTMGNSGLELALDANGLRKSKLAATYLNLPFSIEVGRRWGLTFGVGGYVGYRVASWTKAVTTTGGKIKDHDSYFLNNFRYGIRTQLGLGWAKIFANYDLNALFVKDKAPEMNALSVGFRFML